MQLVHVINTVFLNKPHLDKRERSAFDWGGVESTEQNPEKSNFMKVELPFCDVRIARTDWGYVIKTANFPSRWIARLRLSSPRSGDGLMEGLDLSQHQ